MAFRLFNRRQGRDLTGELCLEADGEARPEGEESLEQQVTRAFQGLRLPVYYYLMAFLGDAETADDLTQEVFLRLYEQLHRGQTVENVRLWAFRVAHNLAFDEREQQRRVTRLDASAWDELCLRLPDPGMNPEQSALQRERLARVHAGLQWLSPQERQCLLLRAEGLRYREIGEVLGVATSTVSEFLQRAMRKLMKANTEK